MKNTRTFIEGEMNVDQLSGGYFQKMLNLTTREINFDNGVVLLPSNFTASIKWHDDEVVKKGFLFIHRVPVLSEYEIKKLDELLGDDTLGIVSIPVIKAAEGTILEGRVAANIFTQRGGKERISFSTKFTF